MIGEIMLAALAEAIMGVLIENAAQRPAIQKQLAKIRGDSLEKRAVENALRQASALFDKQHPGMSASLFDEHFLKQPAVAGELAKLLLPGRTPDIDALDRLWRSQVSSVTSVEIKPAIACFVKMLERAYKAEPDLLHFTDSRNLENIATSSGDTASHTEQIAVNTGVLIEKVDSLVRVLTPASSPAAETPLHIPPAPPTVLARAQIALNPFIDIAWINDPDRFFGCRTRLAELQGAGTMMLQSEDVIAVNAWLRAYARVWVQDNQIVGVEFI